MSAASEALPFQQCVPPAPHDPRSGAPGTRRLSRSAKVYVALLGAGTLAAVMPLYARAPASRGDWVAFALLATAATLAQLFPVPSPRGMTYHTSVVFLVAAALLLPPELLVLIPVIQTVPEWIKERHAWPTQAFNIANYTLDSLAAWEAARLVLDQRLIANADARFAAAGLAACLAFVVANHALVALILHAGSGRDLRATGLFSVESISIDLVLTMLGLSLAAFWTWNPWLVSAALAPLVVVHRSLSVSQLQAEARVDPKTGLYNARYFATALTAELARAARFERPLSLIMADLDLLRDVNNTYGHLAGDAVIQGIAGIFRDQLRHYDVPARFGGEEFSILLPETASQDAHEIAERIRRAVAEHAFEVETTAAPLRVTVSIGVASFPDDGADANDLIHQADLAVYRAKLQGRNRVLAASAEPLLLQSRPARALRLRAVRSDAAESTPDPTRSPGVDAPAPDVRRSRLHDLASVRLTPFAGAVVVVVAAVGGLGTVAGLAGLLLSAPGQTLGLLALVALVAGGEALSFELAEVEGAISVGTVGALAGAALFGYRAALPLALTIAAVRWSDRRTPLQHVLYSVGTLSLSGLAAAAVFSLGGGSSAAGQLGTTALGILAGAAHFVVSTGLVGLATAAERGRGAEALVRDRLAALLPHHLVYGLIGAVIGVAYESAGLYAFALFAVPVLLMRRTQEAYLQHTQRSARRLHEAAETINSQNVSLERANQLLRERTTAAMESLSATVDARDAYTAGHSRRVQQLSLAIGNVLGLSDPELDLLGHAALFHDIGKLAVPDSILLKPGSLTPDERRLIQSHAEEGARIIGRLGFLGDAVPAIRHHHERWDGHGYPNGLAGEDIPLGARIIHVADALDSMLTTRIYRAARPTRDALTELHRETGTQFCPRCVAALDTLFPLDTPIHQLQPVPQHPLLAAG